MLNRIAVLGVIGLMGCAGSPRAPNVGIERFEAYIQTQQLKVEFQRVLRATLRVLASQGMRTGKPYPYAGRTMIKAAPPSRQPGRPAQSGCQVEIFQQPTGIVLRATCHKVQMLARPGVVAMPKRIDWEDRYLVARIIEQADPARRNDIWSFEPTGYVTRRCAYISAGPTGMPPECARARRRR
jgi:hypothetical protein